MMVGGAYIGYLTQWRNEPACVVYYYEPILYNLRPGEQERDVTFWLGIEGEEIE